MKTLALALVAVVAIAPAALGEEHATAEPIFTLGDPCPILESCFELAAELVEVRTEWIDLEFAPLVQVRRLRFADTDFLIFCPPVEPAFETPCRTVEAGKRYRVRGRVVPFDGGEVHHALAIEPLN